MTAAQDSLARWREVEQGATEGPWHPWLNGPVFKDDGSEWIVDSAPTFICSTHNDDERSEKDAAFIATSREALPKLLAFAEAVLDLHEGKSAHSPVLCPLTVCSRCAQVVARAGLVDEIDSLAEQHLTEGVG